MSLRGFLLLPFCFDFFLSVIPFYIPLILLPTVIPLPPGRILELIYAGACFREEYLYQPSIYIFLSSSYVLGGCVVLQLVAVVES